MYIVKVSIYNHYYFPLFRYTTGLGAADAAATETHFDGEGAYSINAEQCTGEPAVATTAVAEKTYHPYIITLPEIT